MKKKTFIPGSTKVLLALTSLAGTVGFWNIISNQSLAAARKSSETIEVPADLAPMPTVVPLVQGPISTAQTASGTESAPTTLREVDPQQSNAAPVSSGAVSAPEIIPNPITTTGSSK